MTHVAANTAREILSADELIIILENERAFYEAWHELAQRAIPQLFSTRPCDGARAIQFGWSLLHLSVSSKTRVCSLTWQLIDEWCRTRPALRGYSVCRDTINLALTYFMDKLITEVQQGNIRLSADIERSLSQIYGQGTDHVNVAQACRDTGKTRHGVLSLMETYDQDMYRRYREVCAGRPYVQVMNDCAPYIHNYPKYTPKTLKRSPDGIAVGDYVAEWGSEVYHQIDAVLSSDRMVSTDTGGMIAFPVNHIAQQHYRD